MALKKRTLLQFAVILILSACSAAPQPLLSPTTASYPSNTPLAATNTLRPTMPPKIATVDPVQEATGSAIPVVTSVAITSTPEVDLPVRGSSLQIGKGKPTALAVSPDGLWMAVATEFGVYQYRADTFEQAWFAPLAGKPDRLVFDPQGKRLAVNSGASIFILDAATGETLALLENAGSWFDWSPDGKRLVSGTGCVTVQVWDAGSGAILKELSGNKCSEGYSGTSVAWGSDGRIYGAVMGTTIMAWDGETYDLITDFSAEGAPNSWIDALFAASKSNLLAQYDSMGSPIVAIIDLQQNRQVHLLDKQVNGPISSLSWAPDGQRLAVSYGMDTGLTLVWNAMTGEVEQTIEGLYGIAGLGWSPDGKVLYGLMDTNGNLTAVEVSSGKVLRTLDGHAGMGAFLTWTQDGLVSTNGATLTWWDPSNGQALRQETAGSLQSWVASWPPAGPGTYLFITNQNSYQVGTTASRQPLVEEESHYPSSTEWSPDGSKLADPTRVWDAQTGQVLAQLHDPAQQHVPDKVAWSSDGNRLASADSLDMQPPVIWDAQTGNILLTLKSDTGTLRPLWLGLAWSPDGKQLAAVGSMMHPDTGEDEGMILIWDAQTGEQEQLLTAAMHGDRLWTVAWSPDGQYLASGTTGSEIFVWDMANHTPLAKLEGHTDIIDRLAWSPDGLRLASVARDGTLQIWDL